MKRHPFFFFLSASFAVHCVFIGFLLNAGHLWSFFEREQKVVVPASIRVDMVGLPDLIPKKKAAQVKKRKPIAIPKKTKNKKVKKKAPKGKEKKSKEKKKSAKKESRGKHNHKQNSPDPKQKVNKGNRLSEGSDKGEEVLNAQQTEITNIYMGSVVGKIESHWNLPKHLTDLNLKAQVEIRIDDTGQMIYKQMIVSSGNELFDSYVIKAMESAAPYSIPPFDAIVRRELRDGVVLTLSSRD